MLECPSPVLRFEALSFVLLKASDARRLRLSPSHTILDAFGYLCLLERFKWSHSQSNRIVIARDAGDMRSVRFIVWILDWLLPFLVIPRLVALPQYETHRLSSVNFAACTDDRIQVRREW